MTRTTASANQPLYDAVVVGGGPAGLGFAIAAAQRGLSVVVLERRRFPVDKVCGEGILPAGRAVLRRLGVERQLLHGESWPLANVRYVDGDGETAEIALPAGGGLGVRRLELSRALAARAAELGVQLVEEAEVVAHEAYADRVEVHAALGGGKGSARASWRGRLLVAADGLGSKLRARQKLARPIRPPSRYGLNTHFSVAPWTCAVEVYLADGFEAYVTPVGAQQVGVAFLWESPAPATPLRVEALLERVPALRRRLASAGAGIVRGAGPAQERSTEEVDGTPQANLAPSPLPLAEGPVRGVGPLPPAEGPVRGVGPLARRARSVTSGRIALVGDAAGYVDAITGEGISLGLQSAEILADEVAFAFGQARTGAALDSALRQYRWRWRLIYWRYSVLTKTVLFITRRHALRSQLVRQLADKPTASRWLSQLVLG